MRKTLVVGNWKMNGGLDANEALLKALADAAASFEGVDVSVCVPFPYLFQPAMLLENTPHHLGCAECERTPDRCVYRRGLRRDVARVLVHICSGGPFRAALALRGRR